MRPFHTITVPHKDILEGKFTMDVYAANLWKVFHQTGPAEYHNADEFFKKTYLTKELSNLLDVVEKRLKGKGGDPVIQLQTPFGGGKTHTLIALYHKAAEWKAKPVVIVGEEMNTGARIENFDTPWGILEKQLSGKVSSFDGYIPPGGEQIRKLLEKKSPVLILMDEMIPYLNKCDAVKIEGKNFATLVLDFIQTLTNVVASLKNVCFVLTTTPSNPNDKSQRGAQIVSQLQNIIGRVDVARTPVQDEEISSIIRRRLFSKINDKDAKNVVDAFLEYSEKNSIIPVDTDVSEYKKRFLNTYPFLPEVIDVLYHRWGSFPNFQRTRGVLRLLALVVYAVKEKNIPYISLSDFDLRISEIRLELLKHIGNQFDSVLDQDIIGVDSGASKVDKKVCDSYKGLKLGTRTATAIFLYSFSGGHDNGITLEEAKRVATTMDCPAATISDIFEDLKNSLFFLKNVGNKYLFTTEPNLNQILNIRMENIRQNKIKELQEEIFRKHITNSKLKTYYLPNSSGDVPDNPEFKLVILKNNSESVMRDFIEKKGNNPRVNRNTIFFLVPMDSERLKFENNLRKYLSYKEIEKDGSLNLSDQQLKEIKTEIKKLEEHFKYDLRSFYRMVFIPDKNSTLKEVDLGIPTIGDNQKIDDEVYNKLRANGEILERIQPIVIREKFLKGKDSVAIESIYIASLTTQGETRYYHQDVLNDCIRQGVQQGIFGIGIIDNGNIICKYFNEYVPSIDYGDEVIISAEICKKQKQEQSVSTSEVNSSTTTSEVQNTQTKTIAEETATQITKLNQVKLEFDIPLGKTSSLLGMINYLQKNFKKVNIQISAYEGEMDKQDYEDKIKETLRQMGVDK